MSWLDNRRAKHEQHEAEHKAKVAAKQAAQELQGWQEQDDILAKLKEVADTLAAGSNAQDAPMMTKPGELVVMAGPGRLHEVHATAGHYSGASQGVSIPIGMGVRYRVGATRGTFQPGPQVDSATDSGQVFLTTQRVVFTGAQKTREWDFSKWVSAECDSGEHVFVFHVSNQAKVSGVVLDGSGPAFNRLLDLALTVYKIGAHGALAQCAATLAEHRENKPPSLQSLPQTP